MGVQPEPSCCARFCTSCSWVNRLRSSVQLASQAADSYFRMRNALERTLLALVLIQLPFAAVEATSKLGRSDHIQGTF